jgi:hypothetical protein
MHRIAVGGARRPVDSHEILKTKPRPFHGGAFKKKSRILK